MRNNIAICCYKRKQPVADEVRYRCGVERKVRETLAKNLERLMKARAPALTQKQLAARSGVSQRTISNMLNPGSGVSPMLENIELIAVAFSLEPWHLLIPDLPDELLRSKTVEKLVQTYAQLGDDGRASVTRIAENEVRYSQSTGTLKRIGHEKKNNG